MSKKAKKIKTVVDFDTGIGEIIPATQEAYREGAFSVAVRKEEKISLAHFKASFAETLDTELKGNNLFPTNNEVFIFIIQYFAAKKEYARRDIDNIAKTILDVLGGRLYRDDSQVKTLLVGKKMEKRVPQNFAYIAIKKLSETRDVDALKISGIERSVIMFQELKNKNIL
jgi:Holliday junction resolvase RusA-like endonuclease